MKLKIMTATILFAVFTCNAGVKINNLIGQGVEKLLLDKFVGSGVEISNAKFNGEAIIPYGEGTQFATFKNISECGMLNIQEGLMLCTDNSANIVSKNIDFLLDNSISAKEINEFVNGYYKDKIREFLIKHGKYIQYYIEYGCPDFYYYDAEFFPLTEEEYDFLHELQQETFFQEAVKNYYFWENAPKYTIENEKNVSIYAIYKELNTWNKKYYEATEAEIEETKKLIEQSDDFQYSFDYLYMNIDPIKYDKTKENLYMRMFEMLTYSNTQNEKSDEDLEKLTNANIKSPSILEFDFTTIDDSIAFNYVFASQEYPKYVNTQFNDAFAFIVTDLTTGEKENIAKIPETDTYVSINNVNEKKNSKYFVANYESYDPEFSWNPDFTPIYKDCNLEKVGGFTTTLTAKTKVVPCRKYHLKLAIGNAMDNGFQSIVFLEAGSFKSNGISSKIRYQKAEAKGIANECSNGEIVIHIKESETPTKIKLKHIGKAKNGTDYKKIPEEIVVPAHQDSLVLELIPLHEIEEDSLEILMTISMENSCSNTQEDTLRSYIYKASPISITPNIAECCATELSVEHTGDIKKIVWEPADLLKENNSFTVNTLSCPEHEQTFTIKAEGLFGCQQAQETLVLKPCANEIEMSAELVTENGSSELITGCNTGKIVFHINQSIAGKDDVKIGINIPSGYNIEGLPKELTIPASDTTFEIPVTAKIEDTPYHNTFNVEATCEECITEPVSIEITTTQLEPLRLEQENTYEVCEPGGLEVEVKLISGTLGEVIWEPTDLLLSTDSLRATLTEDLDSSVVLTVKATDQTGCLTDVSTINIVKKVCLDLTIPPFFTPDKNGINEIWKVYGLEKSEKSKVRIYDRWGKLLVEFNPNTEGWDGTYNGHPCPSSDYWYVIDCEELDKIYTGHFTLIRK